MRRSIISSEKLDLSLFHEEDAEAFLKLTQNDGFNAYPITVYRMHDLRNARQWIEGMQAHYRTSGNLGKYAVRLSGSEELIGMGGLTPWKLGEESLVDITYRLHASAWGKGLGLELAKLLVHLGFNKFGLNEITATITPDNLPSKAIAEKIGLKFDRSIILLGVATDLYRLHKNY